MGKLVTFWSPYKGHGTTTSSLCAIAGGFLLQYPEWNLAISYTQKDSWDLPGKLDNRSWMHGKKDLFKNVGINSLKLYIRQMVLSDEIIGRCGIPLQAKSLSFYPNVSGVGGDEKLMFQILTKQLKRAFDVVFLDLETGNRKEADYYMKEADLAIILLPTEPAYVDWFVKEEEKKMEQVNYGIVFGGCLSGSKYNCTYYKKNTDKIISSRILGEIYRNVSFLDAMCDGKTIDFFLRNQLTIKKEENYEFICQAKKTAENIAKKIILT
jgi:hypothetical protein